MSEVRYIESLQNYVRIVTRNKTYIALMSLRQLEKELRQLQFCRVHRSFIVSISHINSFDHKLVYIDDITIPIGPLYRKALQSKIRLLGSDENDKINKNWTILSSGSKEKKFPELEPEIYTK